MSLFDDIMGSYILEDNIGEDDDQQQNPDEGTDAQDAGGDQNQEDTNTDDTGTDDDNQDDNDEYQMNDPEEDTGENDDQGEDQEDNDEYQMNDPEEDNSEEGAEDDNQDDDEYQMNDPEADDSEEDTTDTNTEDPSDPSQKLKDIEKSIFDQLTPEQQKTKTAELKNLYSETYDKCQSIIDIVGGIEKAPDQAKIYDYIVKNLLDLQKYIRDYLENLFDSKTYIENMTELQKYLAILDTINNVFNELQKKPETDAKQ